MGVALALVHHANQYLITEGYDNRPDLRATLGSVDSKSGLAWILELHRRHNIPANVHLSGTLLEAIAWHQPDFLLQVRELLDIGLIGLVGSCYAQNIMRFFSYEHNLRQLNEGLLLYKVHLGVDPESVKVFWPPERVWDTPRMAPVLTDSRLPNHGYRYVLLDDRLLLKGTDFSSPRKIYDREPRRDAELHRACVIEHGHGLVALPIASHLRLNIPPNNKSQFNDLRQHFGWLATLNPGVGGGSLIAVYGDDMEKVAGLDGWNKNAPEQFEAVLRWLSETPSVQPLRICDCAAAVNEPADARPIDVGTFLELANHYSAGEGYEKWFFDPQWDRYRGYFSWAERRVEQFSLSGADPALLDLAQKHLIASTWETAWHTPSEGPFGDPHCYGHPSPWIQALGSHCRHASAIAEAAHWAKHHDEEAHAQLYDIDADGEDELILKNDKLFAVISPRWGARLVALFDLEPPGKMVIGNPTDDWNWMQELNRFMEVPPNHPGALCDVGLEHDAYEVNIFCADGCSVETELQNVETRSAGRGLMKRMRLLPGESRLQVGYVVPESLTVISVSFALSPDYLNLLRYGRARLAPFNEGAARGWSFNHTAVWVREDQGGPLSWSRPFPDDPGHKACYRLSTSNKQFAISIGVSRT